MSPVLFGILQLDRGEPHGLANMLGLVQAWLQDAGGFAAVGLVIYLIYALSIPTDKSQSERLRVPVTTWMVAMAALCLVCYAMVGGLFALQYGGGKAQLFGMTIAPPDQPPPPPGMPVKLDPPAWHWELRPMVLMVAGLLAILGIGQPFARDAMKVKFRRVWALSKLGFKEAVRFRIHWLLLALALLPFLFRNVWMSATRPVDEFRTLVVFDVMFTTVWVLAAALLLASFSLPNDIKNLTIHTVVTKPVERFEIILGRFLGYTGLMTLTLAGMTAITLLLIKTSTIDERALKETATARVPVRGKLEFKSRKADFDGTNVGREFDYRRYIGGHPDSPQRAIWHFTSIPSDMTHPAGDAVPVEFTFDVYKLTKGDENKGVFTSFRFVTHNCPQLPPRPDQRGEWQWADADAKARYDRAVADLPKGAVTAEPGTPQWADVNKLAEEFGFYEVRAKEVYDYAVMGVMVPGGLFRNAMKGDPGKFENGQPRPRASAYVTCESPGQLLGMAEPDLYLLEANQPFEVNFVKGMVGLWCRLCIIIGLAVACSTYLSGVLSLLVALMVYMLGYFTEHLTDLALNRSIGGGPFEAMSRLVKAEQPTMPSGDTAGAKVLQGLDVGWSWMIRRIQNVIPDVESFTWTNFVSEGFNVNGEYLLVNVLVTLGYLLPWAVLAYYLLKSREVAS